MKCMRFDERQLYALIVGATLLGIVLPIASIVLQFSANDFALWQQYKARHPRLESWFDRHPHLDGPSVCPWLSKFSWHHAPASLSQSLYRYYRRYAFFNLIALIPLIAYRRRIRVVMSRAIDWLHAPSERYARRVVFGAAVFLIVSYLTRAHAGFWFAGIAGWTYENLETRLSDQPPQYTDGRPAIDASPEDLRSLVTAIRSENARYLPKEGYLTAPAILLHYEGTAPLPANLELTDLVFAYYVLKSFLYTEPADPELFGRLILSGLRSRNGNMQFLLPAVLAYPNHSKFMPVSYGSYPDPEKLERVSIWVVSIFASPAGKTRIVAARRVCAIDVLQD